MDGRKLLWTGLTRQKLPIVRRNATAATNTATVGLRCLPWASSSCTGCLRREVQRKASCAALASPPSGTFALARRYTIRTSCRLATSNGRGTAAAQAAIDGDGIRSMELIPVTSPPLSGSEGPRRQQASPHRQSRQRRSPQPDKQSRRCRREGRTFGSCPRRYRPRQRSHPTVRPMACSTAWACRPLPASSVSHTRRP